MTLDYDLHISSSVKCRPEDQRMAAVKDSADLWRSGDKKEAVRILSEIFNEEAPSAECFLPYVKEFGCEYRNLVSKLYLLHIDEEESDWNWYLQEFENACGGDGLFSKFAADLISQKWEEVREKFYEKCPECMFMGDADEPFSLKLRSENCIECIPEDRSDLHELAAPAERYNETMDGYSFYEGYALVKDDPAAKTKYPAEIKDILKKIKARKLKYFPNVIFPLTSGKDILDTCRQMQELLELLDHGYHFESISRYITDHPEIFPDIVEKRSKMLFDDDIEDLDDDFEPDDIDFEFDDEDIVDFSDDCDKRSTDSPGEPAIKQISAPEFDLPEPDLKRIAEDRARGGEFSDDKRILKKYPEKLRTASYEVPAGVIAIAGNAFRDCKNLKNVKIPQGVIYLGESAFSGCKKLVNVEIPQSTAVIGEYVFGDCESLTEAIIPDGVKGIGKSAFHGCSALKNITIPASVRKIGAGAFWDCNDLTQISIPEGVTEIGDHAFCECYNLSQLTIPSTVKTIGECAFEDCRSLSQIVIPEGVTAIEESTFWSCGKLKKAVIPSSITKIGRRAFWECKNLQGIIIPETVTEIGDSAFNGCEKLTKVLIPAGVAKIGAYAFCWCKSIAELVISEGVMMIEEGAFGVCENLTEVIIPEGVLIIGDKAFKKCSNLAKVVIPSSVRSVGSEAFAECPCESELKTKFPHLFP